MNSLGRVAICIACFLAGLAPIRAQDTRLKLGDIIEGSLEPGATHRFTLTALELTLLSLRVESLSDSLDPVLRLYDRDGDLVIENDDLDYPETQDAAIQAFVAAENSTYTVAVSGYAGSSGDYRLHMLPGFDVLAQRDSIMEKSNWVIAFSDTAVNLSESSLFAIELQGYARSAVVLSQHFPREQDLYYEAAFHEVTSSVDWKVGLVFRYIDRDNYHRILLSKTGFWRAARIDGGNLVQLKNWTTHPAIRPGEPDFRLGVLASGQHFDVVYNGQVVGSVSDDAPPQPGQLGIAMRTDEVIGGLMSFAVLETVLTLPTRVNEAILFPQRVVERRNYLMAHDLARKQLVPAGRDVSFVQPESSVRHVRAGVTRIAIASDRVFDQFAIGASLTFDSDEGGNGGCGVFFHYNDGSNYTLAYMTSEGDFGVSRRVGDKFEPGIYGMRPAQEDPKHYLLVIASDEVLHYYLDEEYVGSMESQPRTGSIGIAVVNYEPVDTSCRFEDLWLQSFDD